MTLIDKIKFSLLLYFSFTRIYKASKKASKDLNKFYWVDGNNFNIRKNKWRVENGIPLGLYTHGLNAPIIKRVNVTGMCEYCFALCELGREEEQHVIVNFITENIVVKKGSHYDYAFWDKTFSHDSNCFFVDGMGQGQLLSLLTRYSISFPTKAQSDLILKISNSFLLELSHEDGFVGTNDKEVIFEEYSRPLPCKHVLNGWLYAITGLHDFVSFAQITALNDPLLEQKRILLNNSLATLERAVNNYNLGFWSTYQQPKSVENIASIHYHIVHIAQLRALYNMTGNRLFLKQSNRLLFQYYNPFFRILALFMKAIIANLFKHGRLYRRK